MPFGSFFCLVYWVYLGTKLFAMKSFKIWVLSIGFLLSYTLHSQSTFNLENSKIKWTGKEISTKSHYGSLKFSSASLVWEGNTLKGGKFVVDMTSLENNDLSGGGKERLERHLKSDDFFSVAKHPTATLEITQSATKGDDGTYAVSGDLTIKGITHPVRFTLSPSGNQIHATLTFDRSKYDVRFRSGTFFQNLGDKLILDDIVLEVALTR